MNQPEPTQFRPDGERAASGPTGPLIFLVGIVVATVASMIAMDRYPLSTAGWIGFLVVMILAIGVELVAFARID
jgi:hypothetical protein